MLDVLSKYSGVAAAVSTVSTMPAQDAYRMNPAGLSAPCYGIVTAPFSADIT
jgi:hypothetical protein